jgi:hypothetical protein
MQMLPASPFAAVQDLATQPRNTEVWDAAEICLLRTADALHQARAGSPAEISQAITATRAAHTREKPTDLLSALANVQSQVEENLDLIVLSLGDQIAQNLSPYAPLIPFAGKLIAPAAFYEANPQLHQLARVLRAPVVYVEDSDAIGVASANPIAAAILADEIRTAFLKRIGIRPFVTIARLDYESWTLLNRKHFDR